MGGSLLSLIEIFYHLTVKKAFEKSHRSVKPSDEETGSPEGSKHEKNF